MTRPIPPLDLMWLIMETQASPTHVGALLLFEKPANRPRVVREIVEAYRRHKPSPPFNCVAEVGGASLPHFRDADSYDPRYHVQHIALPEGATYDDLLRLVADLHEPMLDRSRPLFRDWLIDGVPGGRFAIYTKVHHAIVDGVSGMKRIHSSLSTSPRKGVPAPAFATKVPAHESQAPRELLERLAAFGVTATKQTRALRDVSVGALRKGLAALLGDDPGGSQPFTAHRTPMNEPLHAARSLATLSLPVEQMRAIGRHFGATLNDLAVTIVDEGLHRYLRATGRACAHRLVAMCPMSLRGEGDHGTGTKASAMFVHLGDPKASVAERIAQVSSALGAAKEELRAMSTDAATTYAVAVLGLAELSQAPLVDRVAPPLANMVISNVPGGRERQYLNGAPLVGLFPVSAIAATVGFNATLTSCHNRMDFGFVGNGSAMHDLSSLAVQVQQAYEELQTAVRVTRPRAVAGGPSRASPARAAPRAGTASPRRRRAR
jgi:WS/DGAT/MGAT family acyltransferase